MTMPHGAETGLLGNVSVLDSAACGEYSAGLTGKEDVR
jgi:hypothetical protein